jgi:hypothetical protein
MANVSGWDEGHRDLDGDLPGINAWPATPPERSGAELYQQGPLSRRSDGRRPNARRCTPGARLPATITCAPPTVRTGWRDHPDTP